MKILFIAHYICNILSFIYVLNVLKIIFIHEVWKKKKHRKEQKWNSPFHPKQTFLKVSWKFCKKVSHGTVCTHVFIYISHIVYTILHLDFDIKYLGKQLFLSEQVISY